MKLHFLENTENTRHKTINFWKSPRKDLRVTGVGW